MKKLFFFGDSICFGHMVSPHKNWCSMISKHYENEYIVNNHSINGNTTRDALNRITHCIESHKPEVVYVQFGLNDSNFWKTDSGNPRILVESFRQNLIEIIDRLQNIAKVKKIILGTNHLPTKEIDFLPKNTYKNNVAIYNRVIKDVAHQKKVLLIDHEQGCQNQGHQILLEDGVHLNEFGHHVYFKNFIRQGIE